MQLILSKYEKSLNDTIKFMHINLIDTDNLKFLPNNFNHHIHYLKNIDLCITELGDLETELQE